MRRTGTMIVWCGILAVSTGLAGDPGAAVGRNRIGLYVKFLETEATAFGLQYHQGLGARDRLWIAIDRYAYQDTDDSRSTMLYSSVTETRIEGEELTAGYFRRLSGNSSALGVLMGPSAGVRFERGELEKTESGFDGFRNMEVRWKRTNTEKATIRRDPEYQVHANVMAEYTYEGGVGVFGLFSFGYGFGADVEHVYTDGRREITRDADGTLWRFGVGLLYAF